MSDPTVPGQGPTFDQYVANVDATFQAAHDALERTDRALRDELGGPDPNVSEANARVLAHLKAMQQVHPQDVQPGDPVTPEPLPEPPTPTP